MPRYLVRRTFPEGLRFPGGTAGAAAAADVVTANAREDVTWVHSYVDADDKTTWCIYDGPSPEAIRAAASHNGLPVDEIVQVRVLDPFAYGGGAP